MRIVSRVGYVRDWGLAWRNFDRVRGLGLWRGGVYPD